MEKLTSTFMKKHLILYNKLVRKQTYKSVSKMKKEDVRENFKRDFREIISGKDGKKFYAPKKYEVEIDDEEGGDSFFKLLSNPKQEKKKFKFKIKEKEEPPKKKEAPKKKETPAESIKKHLDKLNKLSAKFEKKEEPKKKAKKERSAKQKANDKKLGEIAKKRAKKD